MPADCKKNKLQTPVYDIKSFGYRNRRNIETKPEHLQLLWNCGKTKRPPTQLGIMALEGRNNILNTWNFKLQKQGVGKGVCRAEMFDLNNTAVTLAYWIKQTSLPRDKRAQPGYPTHFELFRKESEAIEHLFHKIMNFSLFDGQFRYLYTFYI